MLRLSFKILVLAACIFVTSAGCLEQAETDTKKARLLAGEENIRLRKEIERLNSELKKQKGLFNNCLREKEDWKRTAEESVGNITAGVLQKNAEQREEIKKLKAEIEQLKSQVQKLEKKLAELKKPQT